MIKCDDITHRQFEELCYELMEANGFKNIEWFGKGGADKGRDLTAVKYDEPLSGIQKERRWVVQCKRYIKAPPNKTEIEGFLVAAREHSPDVVLLIITNTLSANLKDWLKSVKPAYEFEIFTWEEKDLEREIAKNRSNLRTQVKVIPRVGEPTYFFKSETPGVVYMSNSDEFEELGFYILNDYGPKGNAEWLRQFVDYIRHNEIEFEINDTDEDEDG